MPFSFFNKAPQAKTTSVNANPAMTQNNKISINIDLVASKANAQNKNMIP